MWLARFFPSVVFPEAAGPSIAIISGNRGSFFKCLSFLFEYQSGIKELPITAQLLDWKRAINQHVLPEQYGSSRVVQVESATSAANHPTPKQKRQEPWQFRNP